MRSNKNGKEQFSLYIDKELLKIMKHTAIDQDVSIQEYIETILKSIHSMNYNNKEQ